MSRKELPADLFSAAQVRELDRIAIEEYGIPGYELMSRAGRSVFERIEQLFPDVYSCSVVCGAGNNAGDGYIIARLALNAGLKVKVFSLADIAKLKGDALTACQSYIEAGGSVTNYRLGDRFEADLLVDALLGTGLDRPVAGLYADAIESINRCTFPVIAVDIPSGLNADTGRVMGAAIKADLTVSFIGLKKGLFTGDAPEYCGKIYYSSLDVPETVFDKVGAAAKRIVHSCLPKRHRCAHKGQNGRLLILGGELGYSGAVRMAGEAALRVGAGLVTIATRQEHAASLNITRPELMCRGVSESGQLDELIERADIIALGPGLGKSGWSRFVFETAIHADKPMVVDADGLNWLADYPSFGEHVVLTPHPGEAARLLKCSIAEIEHDRFAAADAIRSEYGGICVLKGAGTLVASKERIAVADVGNPGMASGGMGDVLTGVIAGLLAQGFEFRECAERGAYIHGLAADFAAAEGGERGLLASDLMPYLRRAVN